MTPAWQDALDAEISSPDELSEDSIGRLICDTRGERAGHRYDFTNA